MNIINTDYVKKGDNVFFFMIDIYPRGLWSFNFKKCEVYEFKDGVPLIYPVDNNTFERYSFYVRVPRYINEEFAAYMSSYRFEIPKTDLDNNKESFIMLKKSENFGITRYYYLCSSFKGALTALNKYHITNKRYNEITKRKRQRMYKNLFTSWLKTDNRINFVCSTR
jgi:hypothetical protein